MKKLRHILPWAALVMLASTVAISMAALRLASHNKALEAVDVSFIARKNLRAVLYAPSTSTKIRLPS